MPIDSAPDPPDRAREAHAAPDQLGQAAAEGRARLETGRPGPGDGPGTATFRQRQIDAHLDYRKRVEAAEQAYEARQAWEEAVPKLRASWMEHKQKYPERLVASPRAQPDGGWVAGDGRGLSPEQNAEATKACADLRDEADQFILPAMQRVEAASPDGHLASLKNILKGEDRLKEKLADVLFIEPCLAARQAVDKVPDAVRFTLTYSSDRYTDGVLSDVDRLKAEGLELVKLKNLWTADQYKGINSQWRMPNTGTRIEMQFHTPESLEAKELTHDAYERLRRPEAETAQRERDDLQGFQRRANNLLVIPPHVDAIKDFPGEEAMTENTTYYAIIDEDTSLERPIGVFRRVRSGSGQIDEAFSRNLKWEFSPLLYSSERGDTTYDFAEITKDEADRIVDRIRSASSDEKG